MIWVEITLADVLAHLPTDIKTSYDTWLVSYPDKAGRLATLTDNTIREFRDAIKSNPANVVDPRETYLPQSAVRHVESIIIFNLAMEMGIDLDSAGNSARTSADVFLRQIPYGRWNTTTEDDASLPSPLFSVPVRTDFIGRALPLVASLLLFASSAFGGWIKPGSTTYDTSILVTYTPSSYIPSSTVLFGHLSGINAVLAQLDTYQDFATTGAVRLTGSTMTGPLILTNLRGNENANMVIEAGGAISYAPTLYLRAGTNAVGRGEIKISASSLQAEDNFDFVIRGGYSAFRGKNVILQGGEAGGNNPWGNVVLKGDTVLEAKNSISDPARLWLSTNSYLSSLSTFTSLFFVVLQPPSTNRVDL